VNVLIWIATGLLAAVFLAAGATKLSTPKAKLVANPQMGWAAPFPSGLINSIGAAEVAGALGLILPGAFDTATALVPTAAIGLAVLMLGAIITHTRRSEFQNAAVNVVLLALAVFVAVERLGPQSF